MRQIPPSALFTAEVGSTTQFREHRVGGVSRYGGGAYALGDKRPNAAPEPFKIGFGIENRQQVRSGLNAAVGTSPH
jgi:hypothetical protein